MLKFLEAYLSCTGFDACSLQPINGAVGEYAGLLVIRKYQESIGQDLGMKSAHGTNPDSAVTSHIDMKIKSCQSQGVSLEKLMSVQQELRRTRQETEDVKENKLKDLIIVHCYQFDNEMIAVKHHHARVDKADENSQSLGEREAKDQTREQVNKYYLTKVIIWISEIDPSTDTKVENEMLSVKMRLTKAI